MSRVLRVDSTPFFLSMTPSTTRVAATSAKTISTVRSSFHQLVLTPSQYDFSNNVADNNIKTSRKYRNEKGFR